MPSLSREKKWHFNVTAEIGAYVTSGDELGFVQETDIVRHKIMVPIGVSGKVKSLSEGDYTVEDTIGEIEKDDGTVVPVKLMQKWPVRRGRPYKKKLSPDVPLITGQRVIDALFPIAKGGVAAIPGPFGSGKTVTQHQLAKWAEADIVVYIGCVCLKGLSVWERAEKLISIAHPDFREELIREAEKQKIWYPHNRR